MRLGFYTKSLASVPDGRAQTAEFRSKAWFRSRGCSKNFVFRQPQPEGSFPFRFLFCAARVGAAPAAPRAVRTPFAYLDVPALDAQRFSVDHAVRHLAARGVVHRLYGRARHAHLRGRLLLLHAFEVDQADRLVFIQPHDDGLRRAAHAARTELAPRRQAAYPAAFFRSGHGSAVAVPAAGMVAVGGAVVPLAVMLVMAALDIRVICQRAGQESRDRLVRAALHAAQQTDVRLCERGLRAAADAPADQGIHALRRQEACERTVPAAVGVNDLRREDFPVLCLIYFELGGVAEMLEYL